MFQDQPSLTPSAATPAATPAAPAHGTNWWKWIEWEFVVLTILACVCYASRMTDLTIRGEESRRGRIAWEMVDSGDWLVPRVQGLPRLSRPPLQYWVIAATGQLRGSVDAVAVRLPSILATILTVLLIYVHGRAWLSRRGAFAAGAAYCTFAQVLQLGRLGETEALFTLLLSGALLVWHLGELRRWNPWIQWSVAYILTAAATLAKGPQAPVYFAGGVGAYLLLTAQWQRLVTISHAAGILLYLSLVGAWQIPFSLALGQERVSYVYLSEVAKRFEDTHIQTIVSHLLFFPLEIVVGCLFPWSLVWLALRDRDLRTRLVTQTRPLFFLCLCIGVAFPTVWLPPEARSRYFMPLYPCFALLIGAIIDQLPATISLGAKRRGSALQLRTSRVVLVTAILTGAVYVGPIMSYQVSRSHDAAAHIAEVRRQLPAGTSLASFGVVHHLFSYHLGEQIDHHEWPAHESDVAPDVEYFCIDAIRSRPKSLPFAWEEVARINCDRNLRRQPEHEVVVGRRISSLATTQPANAPRAHQPHTQVSNTQVSNVPSDVIRN